MKRTVKRTMVILSTAVTIFAAGILYGGNVQTDNIKTLSLEEAYNAGFPAELPDVVTQPTTGTVIF